MIRSMTGFGRCRETVDGLDVTVEIRSVNSRFLDCNVKLPRAFGYLEERVKPYLQKLGIARGKVDVWVGIEVLDSKDVEILLDEGYLRGYLDALYRLRDGYGLRDDISVMSVARNNDLFLVSKPAEDADRDWACVSVVLEKAAALFLQTRERFLSFTWSASCLCLLLFCTLNLQRIWELELSIELLTFSSGMRMTSTSRRSVSSPSIDLCAILTLGSS